MFQAGDEDIATLVQTRFYAGGELRDQTCVDRYLIAITESLTRPSASGVRGLWGTSRIYSLANKRWNK